jgi:6-pyruvoyltetrahydropterin/6-carboxytetrahydropterin synthase
LLLQFFWLYLSRFLIQEKAKGLKLQPGVKIRTNPQEELIMYHVAVRRNFVAQHFLIGGDWGAENLKHSHHYVLELELAGEELDQHGYLVDIVDIESNLDRMVALYRDKTLNELPEFSGLNPSIEQFARILCQKLSQAIQAHNICSLKVRLWENEIAWAAYELER